MLSYIDKCKQLNMVPINVISYICDLLSVLLTVLRSGKIPESLYASYEQQCKKMAADILEGSVFVCFICCLSLLPISSEH